MEPVFRRPCVWDGACTSTFVLLNLAMSATFSGTFLLLIPWPKRCKVALRCFRRSLTVQDSINLCQNIQPHVSHVPHTDTRLHLAFQLILLSGFGCCMLIIFADHYTWAITSSVTTLRPLGTPGTSIFASESSSVHPIRAGIPRPICMPGALSLSCLRQHHFFA